MMGSTIVAMATISLNNDIDYDSNTEFILAYSYHCHTVVLQVLFASSRECYVHYQCQLPHLHFPIH